MYQPAREKLVLARVQEAAVALAGPLQADAVVRIFERVMDEGRRAERLAGDSDAECRHWWRGRVPAKDDDRCLW